MKFTSLKGVSDQRRLPRLGKIRLGLKVRRGKQERCQHDDKGSCWFCTYPREVDYFVVPPEVAKVYGPQPKKLEVMLPVEAVETVLPVSLKAYRASGLVCAGNGEIAVRRDEHGAMIERTCPCNWLQKRSKENPEGGRCARMGVLNVVLHKVMLGGVYQIATGSWNSIVDCLSGMDYIRAMLGKVSWVPLVLERVPTVVQHTEDGGESRQQTHYTLRLTFEGGIDFVNEIRAEAKRILAAPQPTYLLPAPDVDPVSDPPDLEEAEGPVREAEFTEPPEAKPAAAGAPPAPPEQPKPAQPAEAKPAAKPAPKPAKPAAKAHPLDALASKDECRALWQRLRALAQTEPEAVAAWEFLLKDYCGVDSSEALRSVKVGWIMAELAKLRKPEDLAGFLASCREMLKL